MARNRGASAVSLLLIGLLSGCTGQDSSSLDEGGSTDPSGSPAGSGSPPGGEVVITDPIEAFAHPWTLYFQPNHRLATETATAGAVVMAESFFDPGQLTSNVALPPWNAPDRPNPMRLLEAHVTLWISSDTPQQSAAPPSTPHVFLWMGHPGAWGPTHGLAGPGTLTPGTDAKFEADIQMPAGGLALWPDAPLAVTLGYFFPGGSATPLKLKTGGDHASTFALTVRGDAPLPVVLREQMKGAGTLDVANVFGTSPTPEQASAEMKVNLDSRPTVLEVKVTGSSSAGRTDLDLYILDPEGETVWSSTSPGPEESFRLDPLNLRSRGEWTVRVVDFQGVKATYSLTVGLFDVVVVDTPVAVA